MDYTLIKDVLHKAQNKEDLFRAIVNAPFNEKLYVANLGLGIIVLLLINKKTGTLDRIALSDTELANGAVKMSPKPFQDIKIPLDYPDNLLITAIETGASQQTTDWHPMFTPELTAQEARFNQAGAGIDCSVIYPLKPDDGSETIGAMIFSYYEPITSVTDRHHSFMSSYAAIAANAVRSK